MPTNSITVLHFLLQDILACIELKYVAKVLPLPLLEAVPGCPVYCAGLMNLKSKCIPVLDLGISLGLIREQIYPLNTPVLLCDNGLQQTGLIVDKILDMNEVDEHKIEIHDEFTTKDSPYSGTLTLEAGVSLLINIDWVFALKLTQEIHQVPHYE